MPGHLGARGQGGPPGAVEDPRHQGVQVAPAGAAGFQAVHRPVGHDVRGLSALQDEAPQADLRAHVLAQHVQGVDEELQPVQGVASLPGGGGGVGGFAGEDELPSVQGQGAVVRVGLLGAGVEHEGQVAVVEDPRFRLRHLGSVGLLRGGAHHPDLSGQVAQGLRRRQGRQHRGGAVEVVAAAVPHPGEGVHFRQEGHHGAAGASAGLKRRGQPPEGALDLEALLLQPGGEEPAGFVFLPRQLRVRRQVVAQVHRPFCPGGDGFVQGCPKIPHDPLLPGAGGPAPETSLLPLFSLE